MPWGLKRYQQVGSLHFITFSCYRRLRNLATAYAKDIFEQRLEQVRRQYGMPVFGYVVMPEHVHLLLGEPERGRLDTVIRALKQSIARRLRPGERFWQLRYYDFNVSSDSKRVEKLRYMHRNPVKRGLVEKPEDWPWSSFRHHLTGLEGVVEIESHWTWKRREKIGIEPRAKIRQTAREEARVNMITRPEPRWQLTEKPRPSKRSWDGAP